MAIGQGDIDTQEKMLFQNERSISLSLNSNGFGAGYRFGKRKTYLNKTLYDIEIAYIKHPKEAKASPDSHRFFHQPEIYSLEKRISLLTSDHLLDFSMSYFQKRIKAV